MFAASVRVRSDVLARGAFGVHQLYTSWIHQLPLDVRLDGGPVEAHSTYWASAGGRMLTIATVLPEHGLAFELISTYVGHAGVPAHVTHLALGPVGHPASIEHVEDPRAAARPGSGSARVRV